ncbi:MAG: hypothetical protein PHR39_07990 [Actinomycetota bacterium]|nr:hypothetical protein [Actinomycetota bacterium]
MIKTDIGEYIVGAYLKVIKKCDFIDYNARPPGGGLEGLNELVGNPFFRVLQILEHLRRT